MPPALIVLFPFRFVTIHYSDTFYLLKKSGLALKLARTWMPAYAGMTSLVMHAC